MREGSGFDWGALMAKTVLGRKMVSSAVLPGETVVDHNPTPLLLYSSQRHGWWDHEYVWCEKRTLRNWANKHWGLGDRGRVTKKKTGGMGRLCECMCSYEAAETVEAEVTRWGDSVYVGGKEESKKHMCMSNWAKKIDRLPWSMEWWCIWTLVAF